MGATSRYICFDKYLENYCIGWSEFRIDKFIDVIGNEKWDNLYYYIHKEFKVDIPNYIAVLFVRDSFEKSGIKLSYDYSVRLIKHDVLMITLHGYHPVKKPFLNFLKKCWNASTHGINMAAAAHVASSSFFESNYVKERNYAIFHLEYDLPQLNPFSIEWCNYNYRVIEHNLEVMRKKFYKAYIKENNLVEKFKHWFKR